MKRLTVILFENDLEVNEYSNAVCEKMSDLRAEKVFCGIWGEILFNHIEVLSVICTTINHFVDNTDREVIVFGCCKKDYSAILAQIHIGHCLVDTVSCQDI